MKKYLFILGIVGTALFTACSTADDLISEDPNGTPPDDQVTETALIAEAGQNSDVSIALVAGQSRGYTRAPIDPDPETIVEGYGKFSTEEGKYLGVFCLAMGKQEGAPTIKNVIPASDDPDDIHWNTHPYSTWMDNVPASVTSSSGAVTFKDSTTLSTTPTDKLFYYPFGNWYHYDFFAYYPRQAVKDVWIGQGRVEVSYTITGKEDIIWAHAAGGASVTDPVTSNDVKSYSAKYIRLGGAVPELKFEHKLTQLVFSVKPHLENVADSIQFKTKGYRVTKMEVINVYSQLELYAADKFNGNHGVLKIKNKSTIDSILVRKTGSDDTPAPIDVVSNDPNGIADFNNITPKEVGYALLPTSDMLTNAGYTDYQYLLSIEMEQNGGDPVPNTVITLPLSNYEAGKKYNITLEIYNPANIQATATLESWESHTLDPIPVN